MTEIITVSYKHEENDEHLWAEIRLRFRRGSGTSFILHHVHHAAGPKQPEPEQLLEGGRADIVGYYKQDYTLEEFRKYERKMREALRSKESLIAYVREAQEEGTPAAVLRRLEKADLAFQPSAIAARPPERAKPKLVPEVRGSIPVACKACGTVPSKEKDGPFTIWEKVCPKCNLPFPTRRPTVTD